MRKSLALGSSCSCVGVSGSRDPSPPRSMPFVSRMFFVSFCSLSRGFGCLGVATTFAICSALHFSESGTLIMVRTLTTGPPSFSATRCSPVLPSMPSQTPNAALLFSDLFLVGFLSGFAYTTSPNSMTFPLNSLPCKR